MRIRRLEIPRFRVLRDVDMTFDAGFTPQIFPIGSQNGGGKSTLLQLVFGLLHCAGDPERRPYLRDLLANGAGLDPEPDATLARVTVEHDGQALALEFAALRFEALAEHFGAERPPVGFSILDAPPEALTRAGQVMWYRKRGGRRAWAERVRHLLTARGEVHLTNFEPSGVGEPSALVCRVEGESAEQVEGILRAVGQRVFLLGPSNQQYLFLSRQNRRALVSASSLEYLAALAAAEEDLPGFFAYDWLSIGPLVQLFADARDRDFQAVVQTGAYGDHYTVMLGEVNALLSGKTVRPHIDESGALQGIEFVAERADGEAFALGPEDLSRGELKRLMIYAWLKASKATDGVVLIDEIEASFHPDWQFRIIDDLQAWAPGNQYLLATHSNDLCTALTPAHVRDLPPALTRRGEAGDEP